MKHRLDSNLETFFFKFPVYVQPPHQYLKLWTRVFNGMLQLTNSSPESHHPWDTHNTQFYGHHWSVQFLLMTQFCQARFLTPSNTDSVSDNLVRLHNQLWTTLKCLQGCLIAETEHTRKKIFWFTLLLFHCCLHLTWLVHLPHISLDKLNKEDVFCTVGYSYV